MISSFTDMTQSNQGTFIQVKLHLYCYLRSHFQYQTVYLKTYLEPLRQLCTQSEYYDPKLGSILRKTLRERTILLNKGRPVNLRP